MQIHNSNICTRPIQEYNNKLQSNDISQTLSNSHMYAEKASTSYLQKSVSETENVSNKEFANVCNWFIGKELSIHFDEDKTKYILFEQKKDMPELKIIYDNVQ